MHRCIGEAVPTNKALYAKVKAAAKKKFTTYPSIYANSWVVSEYKRRGGKYRCSGKSASRGGLTKWYREKWVDLSRPLAHGGWASCGRPKVDAAHWRESYPKCRPLAEAKKMTSAEIRSAVRRKRKAVLRSRRGKPTYVKTFARNGSAVTWVLGAMVAALAIAWIVRTKK